MRQRACKYEDSQKRQRHNEHVEESIVALADTIAHPGTVMVESVDAIVAQAAMRGARRPEDFARETVLELDGLTLDEHFLGARRRPICGTVQTVWHFFGKWGFNQI